MFALRLLLLPALAALAAALPAQRPKTAAEALRRYEQVKAAPEPDRRRAVGDLGDFAEPEATAALVAEFARAQELSFRQLVVRALGERARASDDVVRVLRQALEQATNGRLMDSAAEGLARQGDAGVAALVGILAAEARGARRTAVCGGLRLADGDAARDALVAAVQAGGGRDRLPPLDGLGRRRDDPKVDALRLQLATDKDPLVAATALRQLAEHRHADAPALALQLLRRLGAESSPEHYTACLRGLLLAPATCDPEAVLQAAARAEDPFGKATADAWRQAFANSAFGRWFVDQATLRKLPHERAIAAWALGFCAEQDRSAAAATLGKLLANKEPEVVRAAALSLASLPPDLALPPLQKLAASASEPLQPIALQALHGLRAGEADWAAELLTLATGRSAAARASALHLLAKLPRVPTDRAVAAAGANLDHKSWPVRSAAIDLLVAVRAGAGVPLLFERLDAEQSRLRQDVADALFDLTRLRFADVAAWRAWWQKEGATFVPATASKPGEDGKGGSGARPGTGATYWNIPVRSDRVAFVVDVSGSMNQPFGTGSGTRLDEAKRQLVRVLGELPNKAKANIVAFGTTTDALADVLAPLDDKRKKAAEQWTMALQVRGATNVFAGLQRAFADPDVDTIFLLTDGHPSTGEITAPGPLADAVQGWNVGRGIRIHTVAIGGKSDFLERLARDSGGEHTVAK